mmetsp:Transcript_21403/g.40755  ORF Transcript_21403/g.40755 Transcript_21403/m.40755 type:complete len:203 (-) Transcript_21403:778-1386(-)
MEDAASPFTEGTMIFTFPKDSTQRGSRLLSKAIIITISQMSSSFSRGCTWRCFQKFKFRNIFETCLSKDRHAADSRINRHYALRSSICETATNLLVNVFNISLRLQLHCSRICFKGSWSAQNPQLAIPQDGIISSGGGCTHNVRFSREEVNTSTHTPYPIYIHGVMCYVHLQKAFLHLITHHLLDLHHFHLNFMMLSCHMYL